MTVLPKPRRSGRETGGPLRSVQLMVKISPSSRQPGGNFLRAHGNAFANGWANNRQIEAEIAAWYNATSLDEEKTIARRLNRLAVDHALYAPLGVMLQQHAWRKTVSGIVRAPLPLFWGVSKTA